MDHHKFSIPQISCSFHQSQQPVTLFWITAGMTRNTTTKIADSLTHIRQSMRHFPHFIP
ncbi:hypothetical protein GYX91_06325 [Snodgrassella sp. ESL0304]|uniref:hypothetical protein n=1 Tax=Snodgrassella sp. ESL0304 TaxID=2705032 RepID=UPI0015820EE6|nr:hypothetical protein [Snodgrassella sp. ESL0304]NUE80862.1 hypothetical protein [Snodgrassella sp. ESL0304]